MRNLRLDIEYEGTNYAGWQVQSRSSVIGNRLSVDKHFSPRTIQGEIEKALDKITRQKIRITGAGRTDAGVHAKNQVANFKTDKSIPPENFKKALNSLLPADLVVKRVKEVPLKFDARKSAKSKLYQYTILNRQAPSALERNFCWWVPQPLNLAAMRKTSKYFVGGHDFSSFCAAGSSALNKICTITQFKLSRRGKRIRFDIEGDHFLYRMVRNIVGALVEIGSGKAKPEIVNHLLERKASKFSVRSAPARGLCLRKVKY